MVRLGGSGELVTRLPSAVAMAVAAVAVAAVGGRLVSPRAGLAAGLVFAVLPPVSLYGQDARPYAITVALAAIASYLLVRAMEADRSGSRYRWMTGYAVCVAALGILDIFGLLLVVAHAVTVGLRCLRASDAGAGASGAGASGATAARSLAVSWLAAAVAGTPPAPPLLALALGQRGALSPVSPPRLRAVSSPAALFGPAPTAR